MSIPASFLQHVEQHACFSGCYGSDSNISVCLDPNRPLVPAVIVSCQDCLAKMSVPLSLLPAGTTTYSLATTLSDHMRARRGFALSLSGYHARGPGFWLGVIYYSCGVFLLDGERSRKLGSDLELLQLALQHGVVQPPDPRMRDPKQFNVQTVYVNFAQAQGGMSSKQALLASPQCRTQAQPGWQKVTLAEFLPLTSPTPAAAAVGAGKGPAPKALKVGDICPVCKAQVRERPLLNGSFIGCMC